MWISQRLFKIAQLSGTSIDQSLNQGQWQVVVIKQVTNRLPVKGLEEERIDMMGWRGACLTTTGQTSGALNTSSDLTSTTVQQTRKILSGMGASPLDLERFLTMKTWISPVLSESGTCTSPSLQTGHSVYFLRWWRMFRVMITTTISARNLPDLGTVPWTSWAPWTVTWTSCYVHDLNLDEL